MLGFHEQEVGHFTFKKWSLLYEHFRNYHNFKTQNYIFKVTDLASLCSADTMITVPYLYDECEDLIIPTAFTPNGDGYNDTWRIENIELYSKMKIQIYTVNGEKVLDVDGPFEGEWGWNGQLNNDGRYLPSGTYIVMIWRDFDLVGKVKPKSIFIKVVFPAPFLPSNP